MTIFNVFTTKRLESGQGFEYVYMHCGFRVFIGNHKDPLSRGRLAN